MVENPNPTPDATKPRRGRPPNPSYRARLAAAGHVVRLVDISAAHQTSVADYDAAKDGIDERAMVDGVRDPLHKVLVQLELREQDVARLKARNAHLEAELRLQVQHLTKAVKDNFMLKQMLAQKTTKRR
jgi:hypothetical protein